MATAKQIMNKAISYLGTKESPANSNNVVFNTHYYGMAVSGASYPWCCAFVWDIFRMCGASNLFYDGKKTAYCPTVKNWGTSKGLTVDKNSGQYGDIVIFDWNKDGIGDHIGLIEKNNGNGTYTTIEGNTAVGNDSNGGEVMRRTRKVSQIQCIIRPKYNGTASKPLTENKANNPVVKTDAWKGDKRYYIENAYVKEWQKYMNKGFDTRTLSEDGKFGQNSQAFAGSHLLWSGQTHNCISAINWLRRQLHNVYGFTKLPVSGYWDKYLAQCVKVFQGNRGLTPDGIVGLITTYYLLSGIKK